MHFFYMLELLFLVWWRPGSSGGCDVSKLVDSDTAEFSSDLSFKELKRLDVCLGLC